MSAIAPTPERTPLEIGEDALSLMVGAAPVAVAIAIFLGAYRDGKSSADAMRLAMVQAQGMAARQWARAEGQKEKQS